MNINDNYKRPINSEKPEALSTILRNNRFIRMRVIVV